MNFLRGIRFVSILALSAGAFCAFAQSTALLRGVITDPQGALIPSAAVTLTNTSTGFNRQTITNPQGEYQFLQVVPGTYRVTVEKTGFTSTTRTDVQLLVGTPATLDVRLELGHTAETVNVSAETSARDASLTSILTKSANSSSFSRGSLTRKLLSAIPQPDSFNFLQALTTSASS